MRPLSPRVTWWAILLATVTIPTFAHAQIDRYAALANSAMVENRPTPQTAQLLRDELLFQETRYIYTDFDKDGQRLNGGSRYTVTFASSQVPPVNGFWSLTVYNKEHLFEPNPLNRFSLGTKSRSMKQEPDSSLTLYFQNESPGADKEANWVPTPKDEFSLYIRTYWPKAEILNGSWTPPPVMPAEIATGSSTPPAAEKK